jgi:hypothetical protein
MSLKIYCKISEYDDDPWELRNSAFISNVTEGFCPFKHVDISQSILKKFNDEWLQCSAGWFFKIVNN